MSTPPASTAPSVGVVGTAASAAALLHPVRRQILERLNTPDSATGLSRRLELPRQKVNYHLRELERHGLVRLVAERRRGNCTERILESAARSWLISPEAVGDLAADPAEIRDRFSWAYLTALAGRAVRELGRLRRGADRTGKSLATFSLETEVRFATPERRHAFGEALAEAVAALVSEYHDERSPKGRRFRLIVGSYPTPKSTTRSGDDRGPVEPRER